MKVRPGVTFHDGEKLDAAAVKYNIERHKTMAGSQPPRRARARSRRVDVVDPMTVRLNLSAPFSPLLAQLADRAGHDGVAEGRAGGGRQVRRQAGVLGPVQVRRARRAGPHRARALSRTTGTRARSTSTGSSTCRSSIRRCASRTSSPGSSTSSSAWRRPTCRALKSDSRFKISQDHRDRLPGHHDQHRQERAWRKNNALGKDPRVREAFELALDRDGIVQVVMEGEATVRQPVGRARQSVLREERAGAEARRRASAKALLQQAGMPNPTVDADDADHVATRRRSRRSCRRWSRRRAST